MARRGTNSREDTHPWLFEGVPPPPDRRRPKLKAPRRSLWTDDKAALIAEYIHLFLTVTKHGVYLDLFAGPQRDEEAWAVRRVLERRTPGSPSMRYFAVCDRAPEKAEVLRRLGAKTQVPFHVYEGDANEEVHRMLGDAPIKPTTACFCLIDQRTFQCRWSTVRAVAEHKSEGRKIELFYFLAQGWLDRSITAAGRKLLESWWGGPVDGASFLRFKRMRGPERAHAMAERFRTELGYEFAEPFAILRAGPDTQTMYYMIHASDHAAAPALMSRAYNAVPSAAELKAVQLSLLPEPPSTKA